jgi:hypothetical protein
VGEGRKSHRGALIREPRSYPGLFCYLWYRVVGRITDDKPKPSASTRKLKATVRCCRPGSLIHLRWSPRRARRWRVRCRAARHDRGHDHQAPKKESAPATGMPFLVRAVEVPSCSGNLVAPLRTCSSACGTILVSSIGYEPITLPHMAKHAEVLPQALSKVVEAGLLDGAKWLIRLVGVQGFEPWTR